MAWYLRSWSSSTNSDSISPPHTLLAEEEDSCHWGRRIREAMVAIAWKMLRFVGEKTKGFVWSRVCYPHTLLYFSHTLNNFCPLIFFNLSDPTAKN
ncbi:hypothetical protein DVH24_039441 [Malus domestica]|uniref:Uncharacterized protein n=1 Tax=Malus domestica TaxID=3750 RepID=A0A498I0H3_MALDO|nr:hypothetical protein DVH24_039441 [Malus domestica]